LAKWVVLVWLGWVFKGRLIIVGLNNWCRAWGGTITYYSNRDPNKRLVHRKAWAQKTLNTITYSNKTTEISQQVHARGVLHLVAHHTGAHKLKSCRSDRFIALKPCHWDKPKYIVFSKINS
jgi:hypothetical protein